MTQFAPIAIVGRACVLPGASSPEELWQAVADGRDLISNVPAGRWGMDPADVLCDTSADANSTDRTWSDRGGYVTGFDDLFDPEGFAIPVDEILALDPVFKWTFHTAREALRDAGWGDVDGRRVGAIFGNLSFPSAGMAAYHAATSIERAPGYGPEALDDAAIQTPDARNRFTSGLPALLLERALGLAVGAYALDAACASSLYAIKLACDRLHDGEADLMLAGAVNCADDLCIHLGFTALQALSRTGQSRPFHRDADGLVPAEGCGFVALRRLEDAVRDGDTIHGIIRGIGLSNDGRGRGLLVPSSAGQTRAMARAIEVSGLSPTDISLLECHATGTQVGDGTEIASTAAAYDGTTDLAVGSLKSNTGHLITAAGVAGVIKVIEAMRHQTRPATLHVDAPLAEIEPSPFRLLSKSEPWDRSATSDGVLRAAVSAFGFGGNNAHLIVEEPASASVLCAAPDPEPESITPVPIAIVGIGVIAAGAVGRDAFASAIAHNRSLLVDGQGAMADLSLQMRGLKFPPRDLEAALPQQLAMLQVAEHAMTAAGDVPNASTGVYVGMGTDTEVARFGLRWRLASWMKSWAGDATENGNGTDNGSGTENGNGTDSAVDEARAGVGPALDAAGVLGTMANIPANRLNSQYDLFGPSFTVSAEERSGLEALDLAARALRAGELDAALVGAVDLSCDQVHKTAARHRLPPDRQVAGDAAVMLVIKRLDDAQRDGNTVYAILPGHRTDPSGSRAADRPDLRLGLGDHAHSLTGLFGHAHAASGLVHVVAASLALHHRVAPGGVPLLASNPGTGSGLAAGVGPRTASVEIDAMDGVGSRSVLLAEATAHHAPASITPPTLHEFSGDTHDAVLARLDTGATGGSGPFRLVIVAQDDQQLVTRSERARAHITDGRPAGVGVHYRTSPIEGELGFVFTAAGAAYPGMGAQLLVAMPELATPSAERFPLRDVAGWVHCAGTSHNPGPSDYLWGTSLLSQSHARLTRGLLGLKPTAAIGYSSGESSSLVAFGVWNDVDAMRQQIESTGMMERELGVEFAAVARAWGEETADWSVWNVLAPLGEVERAIGEADRVHLSIVNTPNDVVISGDSASCERVVDLLGRRRCLRVGYNLACHVPELGEQFRQAWVDVHTRAVTPAEGVRFYSNGTNAAYPVSTEACAAAITAQAESTLHFPATIEAAYADGVRIFVEHGPAGACTNFIREILGDRDVLAIALDRRDNNIEQVFEVAAALLAAGVDVDHQALTARLVRPIENESPSDDQERTGALTISFASHRGPIKLPPRPRPPSVAPGQTSADVRTNGHGGGALGRQFMAPAPALPPTSAFDLAIPVTSLTTSPAPMAVPAAAGPADPSVPSFDTPLVVPAAVAAADGTAANRTTAVPTTWAGAVGNQIAALSEMHEAFVRQQAEMHERFLAVRTQALSSLAHASPVEPAQLAAPAIITARVEPDQMPRQQASGTEPLAPKRRAAEPVTTTSLNAGPRPSAPTSNGVARPVPAGSALAAAEPTSSPAGPDRVVFRPVGPVWDKAQLEIHSSGRISELFGPRFEPQDHYERQCRMPEPPLLLADRVVGLDAEPGVLGKGTIWTETDVEPGAWYLNDGYMPTGFMIESGQADLMLISYMGIDLTNQGERVYRLLGCELTYHGDLPAPGETLEYEIRITGHAKHGEVRIFFFEYDCIVDGIPRLTVRSAQAGFFNDQELADSLGVLWTPEQGADDLDPAARVDPPAVVCSKTSFTSDDVIAFAEGRPLDCFGPGYEWTQTHTRTPRIQSGPQLFIDEITAFDPRGGPWGRGFMRCETNVHEDDWYFKGHFKNDPCMPGNFMVEACMQAMSFYLAAMGYTTRRDGWRFQPLPEHTFDLKCRGEINPLTDHVTYELHVEEIRSGPHPSIICDVVGYVDGHPAFHGHRIAAELTPDWPLTSMPELYEGTVEPGPVATDASGFPFDWKAMLSCAWGRPSEAFGDMFSMFDGARRSPRLPGLPYHFMSRIVEITGELDVPEAGMEIVCEYDIPADAWFFDENGTETMPFAVLLEAALQPCGWVASAIGSVTQLEEDLLFRNLDGTGELVSELTRTSGVLRTHVKLKSVSKAGGMIIEGFDVECRLGDRVVYTMDTVFGFFPPDAFDDQVGLPISDEHRARFEISGPDPVDLTHGPDRFFAGAPRLANPMLLMIDRVTLVEGAGAAGLGVLRGEKDVDISEWFFKAHFFQDPVQPGSLGVEALIQLLQFFMIDQDMGDGIADPHFEPLMLGAPMTWKYRGQVTPANELITSTMEITDVGTDEHGSYVIGRGSLWCDGLRIYEVSNMGMRIVPGPPSSTAASASGPVLAQGHRKPDGVLLRLSDPETSSRDLVSNYWNPVRGTPNGWLGEDLVVGLFDKYVDRILVPDPDALDKLQDRAAIYMGNHQVQVESLIITHLIPALTGVPMRTIANAKHEARWIGTLIRALQDYPDFKPFDQIVYFQQDQPQSMFAIIEAVRAGLSAGELSFFLHPEGTRATSSRDLTTKCSSLFLDLAIELNVPIVPVRFTGGLPVEPIKGKAEFPIGHGRQDYWIGTPIEADELRALPLRDRVDRVLNSINTLGIAAELDEPLPGDETFAKSASRWVSQTGTHEVFAAGWQILKSLDDPGAETTTLLNAAHAGSYRSDGSTTGDWLAEVAPLFWGADGPTVHRRTSLITVDKDSHAHLVDHSVDGKPVVPVAYALEWMARAAAQAFAHVEPVSFQDLRVFKGIVVHDFDAGAPLALDLIVDDPVVEGAATTAIINLRDHHTGQPHYRVTAAFAAAGSHRDARPAANTVPTDTEVMASPDYTGSLFHGPKFQALTSVGTFTDTGFVAQIRGVDGLGWGDEPWKTDVAATDGLLQMVVLWAEHRLGGRSLPTAVRQISALERPVAGSLWARVTEVAAGAHRVECDIVMFDADGHTVVELLGVENHLLPSDQR